jgi:hypothetical protein
VSIIIPNAPMSKFPAPFPGNAAGGSGAGMDEFGLYFALKNIVTSKPFGGALAVSMPWAPWVTDASTTGNMVNGRLMLTPQLVKGGLQIDGVCWGQQTNGNYTANQSNQIGAYTYDGTNFTRVGASASDGTLWQSGAGFRYQNFAAPYIPPSDMVLWAAGVYNSSAAVTIPQITDHNQLSGLDNMNLQLGGAGYIMNPCVLASANLPASIANASINTTTTALFWLAFAHVYP